MQRVYLRKKGYFNSLLPFLGFLLGAFCVAFALTGKPSVRPLLWMLAPSIPIGACLLHFSLIAAAQRWPEAATLLGKRYALFWAHPHRRYFEAVRQNSTGTRLLTVGFAVEGFETNSALIVLTDSSLVLHLSTRESITVPLHQIQKVTESPVFGGCRIPGQTGLMLGLSEIENLNQAFPLVADKRFATKTSRSYWRLGFAIFDDPAPWRSALCGVDCPGATTRSGAGQLA